MIWIVRLKLELQKFAVNFVWFEEIPVLHPTNPIIPNLKS